MTNIDLLKLSGLELGRLIREKKVTSFEVVQTHIEQAQKVNPQINAVVEDCYEQALTAAKLADSEIAQNQINFEEKKLFGVPHSIKELLAVNGMKCTIGSIHHKDTRSNFDCTALKRLKKQGAILIGTTNVPEAAMWFECDNVIYGPGKNPYDVTRTPGGSSGGEAAIIASGASPFGVGSDIGGSIRMPAAFCGIFGHKPTEKIIPLTGHFPMTLEVAETFVGSYYPFSVVGPLARKAEDLVFLFDQLRGPDGIDRNIDDSYHRPAYLQREDWRNVKVYLLPEPSMLLTTGAESDVSESVRAAGRYFESLGAKVCDAPKRILFSGFQHWSTRAWTMEGRDFISYMTDGQDLNYLSEIISIARGQPKYTLPALLTAFFDDKFSGREKLPKLIKKLNQFKAGVDELLEGNSILVMPPHPRKAPTLGSTLFTPFNFSYTAVFNALNYPATIVPMGLAQNGLPLSVQIAARSQMDHLTLSTCLPLEKEFGGWVMPPKS